jgi:hypothetical protein
MSPSVSKSQQRLMGAAEHGADFPMARKVRESMTHQQLHDFASGSEQGKPEHVKGSKAASHPARNLGQHLRPAGKSGKPWSAHVHPRKAR